MKQLKYSMWEAFLVLGSISMAFVIHLTTASMTIRFTSYRPELGSLSVGYIATVFLILIVLDQYFTKKGVGIRPMNNRTKRGDELIEENK